MAQAKPKGMWLDWKLIVSGLVALIIGSNSFWIWKQSEQWRVIRVSDGDTFVIKTGERVRLIGLDAPETGVCGAEEAKLKLEELVLGKLIRIEGDGRDNWGRRLGIVLENGKNVNLEMIKSGWARYDNFSGGEALEMKEIGLESEEQKRGLFGKKCDKLESCGILGNIDESSGKKYYHLAGCPTYHLVKIDLDRGEKKFCTEGEARSAGFALAPDCVR